MMYTVCVIGAGQLGSRHLQGISKSREKLDVWVVDPSEESLDIAKERLAQVTDHSEEFFHFVRDSSDIPANIDVAIVATGSKPRFNILKILLEEHSVGSVILEKFLFTSLKEYDRASELIDKYNADVYVNCPRRLYPSYEFIKENLDSSEKLIMKVEGTDWGLCCNSIHFIDIFMKLCGESDYEIDTSHLIPEILESKRKGYIEFNGMLKVSTPKGNELILSSLKPEENKGFLISIDNGDKHIEIDEVKGVLNVDQEERLFPTPYQSELTGGCVDLLLDHKKLGLTDYETSKNYHKKFLKTLLDFYNNISGEDSENLPIT